MNKSIRLEEQSYQILDRWKIETILHTELLWINKQIIRMRDIFFNMTENILKTWSDLSLYNHYNPINSDLIRHFKNNSNQNNWALVAKIIDSNNIWPIIDWEKLIEVRVKEMFNVFLEDINEQDLNMSIAFDWKEWTVYDLLEWLSKDFYNWKLSIDELTKLQRLFYRKIQLSNN
jgi:hypothetical protein